MRITRSIKKSTARHLSLFLSLLFLLSACQSGPEVVHDLSDQSFEVVDQDSVSVTFPGDFKGDFLVVGFIYTHCPDICPVISAKLGNVNNKISDVPDVHFLEISFDPRRDKPSVLKKYMQDFNLDEQRFTMLTGDSTTVDSLLSSMDIIAELAEGESLDENYMMNHTNRILIMDKEGRVRFEYPGSAVPEDHIIEDIEKLR